MNRFVFTKVPGFQRIFQPREDNFNDLPYCQEYYLELQIEQAELYTISTGVEQVGYFYLSQNGCLLEYYVRTPWVNQADNLFGEIKKNFSIQKALCKSFDAVLLSCCYTYQKNSQAIGILFRDYSEKAPFHPPGTLSIRRAMPDDEPMIISVNEDVFDHPAEVLQYIHAEQVFVYEKDGKFAGFGIFSPIYPTRPEHDIGMLVAPEFRGMRYGQFIIQHLVHFCLQNNWKPVAGCAIENIASRKCLEKSGFIGKHRLIEFLF